MVNDAYAGRAFNIEKCRVKPEGVLDLANCHVPEQAAFCGYSLSFGYSYFCQHPCRNEFIENTENLQNHTK